VNNEFLKKKNLPDTPGVYRFKSGKDSVYVGKATSLRDRTRSYFAADLIATRGPRILDMVTLADDIDWIETKSVLEALLLESHLIKTLQPKYNVKEKDDRSGYMVVITAEDFPRVLMVRKRELESRPDMYQNAETYGPFAVASQLREALVLIKKLFPYFDTKKPVDKLGPIDLKRFRLNVQIGVYPDVFSGAVSKAEYRRSIKRIQMMFEGKMDAVRKDLERQMKEEAKELRFEKAHAIKTTLYALDHIKDVALIKRDNEEGTSTRSGEAFRVEAYDNSHLGGSGMVGVMAVFEDGEPAKGEYRKFDISPENAGDDYGALTEILTRRARHAEWRVPDLIVIDGGEVHKETAQRALAAAGVDVPVLSVVKDNKHKAREVLGDVDLILRHRHTVLRANDEAHRFAITFQKTKRRIARK
jgi:excinuclease ABC subunit C